MAGSKQRSHNKYAYRTFPTPDRSTNPSPSPKYYNPIPSPRNYDSPEDETQTAFHGSRKFPWADGEAEREEHYMTPEYHADQEHREDDDDDDQEAVEKRCMKELQSNCEDEAEEKLLALELEYFRTRGLMLRKDPPYEAASVLEYQYDRESDYGDEAKQMYPNFFRLIPQKPHYLGLLQGNICKQLQRAVYGSLWQNLVGLMDRALRTTCSTRATEIMEMIDEATDLAKLGFDVRHAIARLRQPMYRLRDYQLAKAALEEVRSRKQAAKEGFQEIVMLKAEVKDLKRKLQAAEDKLGSMAEHKSLMKKLREEERAAEHCLSDGEYELGLLGYNYMLDEQDF